MNREQIMQLEGRELDKAAAEKVMNLCVLDTLQLYGDGCVVSDRGMDEWIKHPMYGKVEDPDFLEPYSTDMNAAWEVEEKVKELGLSDVYGNRLSRLIFSEKKSPVDTFDIAHASTELRCRAALLAVMEVET